MATDKEKKLFLGVEQIEDVMQKPNELSIPLEVSLLPEKQVLSELKKLVADIAVHLWRLQRKMTDENGAPFEENRRLYRHLQAALDDLTDAKIAIRDFDGQIIPKSGVFDFRVLAYQPTPDISSEQVIETIKPAVSYKDETIHHGEVIIGEPVNPGGSD